MKKTTIKVYVQRCVSIHYLVGFLYVETLFVALRLSITRPIFDEYASDQQLQNRTTRFLIESWGLLLGLMQDFCVLAFLFVALRIVDSWTLTREAFEPQVATQDAVQQDPDQHQGIEDVYVCAIEAQPKEKAPYDQVEDEIDDANASVVTSAGTRRRTVWCKTVRFLIYAVLFLIVVLPYCLDNVLFRARKMRFTLDFVLMYWRERNYSADLAMSKRETHITYQIVITTMVFTIGFGLLGALVLDLTCWSPTQWLATQIVRLVRGSWRSLLVGKNQKDATLEDGTLNACTESISSQPTTDCSFGSSGNKLNWFRHEKSQVKLMQWILTLGGLLLVVWVTYAVSCAVNRLSAAIGLNTTLSEYSLAIWSLRFMPLDGKIDDMTSAEMSELLLDPHTEQFELSSPLSLYRRTTGFSGDLSFDVQVDPKDPPNVLVINVESFRYQDSAYLTTNSQIDPMTKSLPPNVSLTPQFDKWAKRNIGFRNLWSNWRTSRAIEAVLFGHAAYDSTTDSLTSTGRTKLKLQGMPQLFKQKGYECVFSTAAQDGYDQWNEFLPTHGFEDYIGGAKYKQMARDAGYDLSKNGLTWNWGLHDDLSFELLGNVLEKKHQEQAQPGNKKRPFFMNHYTISSHTPFKERPDWYNDFVKHNASFPDFSSLYAQETYAAAVKDYIEMRYFTDMALGKFLDRLQANGVLNDTIVLIAGDHGQAPENGLPQPELRYLPVHHVAGALIAEGRLGKYAGMIVDELAHHNDFLNTLADIVGVPSEGFYQTSLGRSLKRKLVEPSKRIVHVSNPMTEYALIQNNLRVQYNQLFDTIHVHDITNDPMLHHDLYPAICQNETQRLEINKLRSIGRFANAYFRDRLQGNCITQSNC